MPTTLAMRTAPTVTVCLLLWPLGCSAERAASQVTDDDARVASLVVQPNGAAGAQSTANRENVAPRGTARIESSQLVYRGAFRLPDGSNESNWEYSGYAMTYYPAGDPDGPDDGYPGSLFAVGHDHQQHVSEIAIPRPVISSGKNLEDLNTAHTLQPFRDIRGGFYGELEIPRAALEYLPPQGAQRTGKLHFAWGQHFEFERQPTHGWCELDLSAPQPAGPWQLGHFTSYVTDDYLFEIPEAWTTAHTPGLRLATGRFRDGTWGGLGPAILAYGPWTEGNPPPSRATLQNVIPLLMYGEQVDDAAELDVSAGHKMKWFSESDEWSGGAWLTTGDSAAVILIGTKAVGESWYGFANGVVYPTGGEEGPQVPEVPPFPNDQRGWWSKQIEAQIIFYDPADLAAVVHGQLKPWEPQPYAKLMLDPFLFDPGFDHERQKRYLVGDASFDRARSLLYIMERRADGEKNLVHVFQVDVQHGTDDGK